MAKKKVAAKKKSKPEVVAEAPAAPVVAAEPEPEAPKPVKRGDCQGVPWAWFPSPDRGRIEASSEKAFSVAFDFGQPVALVSAVLNGQPIHPKVSGSAVMVRSLPGVLSIEVAWAAEPRAGVSVAPWVP